MFENNIFGMVSPDELLDIGYDVTRPNDPVDQVFDDVKTDSLLAYWETMQDQYNIPVMAQFHAFDVESQKTVRVPIDTQNVEKGLIKVKLDQSERLRALLNRGVQAENRLREKVLNDAFNLAEEVFTRTKVAKNEVLYSGKVTIKENNLDLTVDYGVPAGNLAKELDFGAGAAKPLDEQLYDLFEEADGKGTTLNSIYTSKAIITKMLKDPSLQKAINGSLMVGQLIKRADLESYLSTEFGITRILTNDLHYSLPYTLDSNGRPVAHDRRYYPQDRISFFSADGFLGTGIWGDTPSVTAKKFGKIPDADPETTEVGPYVFVNQYKENDPDILWTKAEGLFMPVVYRPTGLYVATAKATPGT